MTEHAAPQPRPSGALEGAGALEGTGALEGVGAPGASPEPTAGRAASPAGDFVVVRPHRLRVVCWSAAAVVVLGSAGLALALGGSQAVAPGSATSGDPTAPFGPADQVALFVLGCLFAVGLLLLTRARAVADTTGVRVRNVVGEQHVPWALVRHVRFDTDTPWAQLELHDDDVVAVLGLQASDGARAFDAVDALRALHARATRPGGVEGGGAGGADGPGDAPGATS